MKELQRQNVESLLEQVQLLQPPGSLDKSVSELFCKNQLMQDKPVQSRSFGFTELCGAAIVALLLGGAIGFSAANFKAPVVAQLPGDLETDSLLTPVVFRQMHGHSSNAQFADCLACHKFANKERQQVEKWQMNSFHDAETRDQLGLPDCRLCHVSAQKGLEHAPTGQHFD